MKHKTRATDSYGPLMKHNGAVTDRKIRLTSLYGLGASGWRAGGNRETHDAIHKTRGFCGSTHGLKRKTGGLKHKTRG